MNLGDVGRSSLAILEGIPTIKMRVLLCMPLSVPGTQILTHKMSFTALEITMEDLLRSICRLVSGLIKVLVLLTHTIQLVSV